jgi:hypothetical protein
LPSLISECQRIRDALTGPAGETSR